MNVTPFPNGCRHMIRLSLPYLLAFNNNIEPLAKLPMDRDVPRMDFVLEFYTAQSAIREFVQDSLYAPYLRASFALANELIALLQQQTDTRMVDLKEDIPRFQLWQIKSKYDQYRVALLAELGTLNSFFVTRKGAYDTTILLNWGEAIFPADLATKVPEALFDAREAAKCIAYEASTAAGFHVFRVTEAVLRRYHALVTNGAAPPKVRNISVYLRAMQGMGDEKILAALKQMADLHRNPLIHPEAVLTTDEAISVAGIGRSAVTAMLVALPVQAPTTATVTALPSSAPQASQ